MCDSCPWKSILEDIEEMEEDNALEFAGITIGGIRDWIIENKHVTDRQELAIANIKAAKEE